MKVNLKLLTKAQRRLLKEQRNTTRRIKKLQADVQSAQRAVIEKLNDGRKVE